MNSRLTKILLACAVVVGGASVLIYSSIGHAQYYQMVHELMVEPDSWVDKDLRVHGFVEPGSIHERVEDQTTKRTFYLESKGKRIRVENEGPKPDTFKELSEVVAEGRVVYRDGEYVLEAHKIMAKCPSKYEGAAQNKNLGAYGSGGAQPGYEGAAQNTNPGATDSGGRQPVNF